MGLALSTAQAKDCIGPSSLDVVGTGVRISIYLHQLLGSFPALRAIRKGEASDYDLDNAGTQLANSFVLAVSILISCVTQTVPLGLADYHVAIILDLLWVNSTNTLVYCLLYVYNKSQGSNPLVLPQWSSWIKHVRNQFEALLSLSTGEYCAHSSPV